MIKLIPENGNLDPFKPLNQSSHFEACCCSVAQSRLSLWAPWTAACQSSLSFTIPWSSLKLMSTEPLMLSYHLVLCHSLLLLPLIFPSIRVFSSELAVHIRWPNYWNFNPASVIPRNIQGWFALWLAGLISLETKTLMSLLTIRKNLTMTNSRQDTNVNCGRNVDIMELPERGS